MDKSKNNKVYLYAYAISFLVILIFFSLLIYKKNVNNDKDNNLTNSWKEAIAVNNMLESWNYEEAIKTIESKGTWSIERDEKMKLVYSYLSYWNYFYKEAENSKKAMDILNTLKDDSEVIYYKGFSQEIIKNYTWALDYYNIGLEQKDITNKEKSILVNQIGHLYDLKWEFDKVFAYYDEAYNLDNDNAMALANLWRYYMRTKENEKAYELLNKALSLTTNLPLKSELCYWLSILELELNWLTPDIDKSIDYARQSIDYYSSYAMWYVALAKWLFMKNDRTLDKEIEANLDTSIELNPDWHNAYYLYVLHEIDKANYEKALEYINKTMYAAKKDMILMDSERSRVVTSLMFDAMIIGTLKKWTDNQDPMMKLINATWKLSNKKTLTQVKRINHWIFSFLKDNKEFIELINNYK